MDSQRRTDLLDYFHFPAAVAAHFLELLEQLFDFVMIFGQQFDGGLFFCFAFGGRARPRCPTRSAGRAGLYPHA
jgi:hypothetical protein